MTFYNFNFPSTSTFPCPVKNGQITWWYTVLKEHSTYLEIGSFYNSPRVKQLSFTVFESIQPISGSGGSTFSLA